MWCKMFIYIGTYVFLIVRASVFVAWAQGLEWGRQVVAYLWAEIFSALVLCV